MQRTNPRTLTINDATVRQRVERLATIERRAPSQMGRILLVDQLDVVEKQMGLPPIESALAQQAS